MRDWEGRVVLVVAAVRKFMLAVGGLLLVGNICKKTKITMF